MAIRRAQVTSLAAFAAWMQENAVPNIFKSVSYNSSSRTITATDDSDNLVLSIEPAKLKAYRAENNAIEYSDNYELIASSWPTQVIGCDNGFLTVGRYGLNGDSRFALLVAKTNNGKPAIIFNRYGSATDNQVFYNGVKHVAFGDSPTMSTTTTFTPEVGQQTSLVPFSTNADIEEVSYTPDAYWIAMSANYSMGIGKFRMGGDTFISNGYWAIKDNQSV